jgi:flagellar assembly factor FliW
MKVTTKAYGEIEIEDRQRISFPRGLFGFEDLRDFVLLDAAQQPFYWLQSVKRVEVAFVLIDPKFFRPDYAPDVDPAELEEIGISDADDMLVFVIVTIPQAAQRMTANLQGPLILNRSTHVARQSISTNPEWGVRHAILDEMAAARENPKEASC